MAGDWRELLFERFKAEDTPPTFIEPVDNSIKKEANHWSSLVKSRLAPKQPNPAGPSPDEKTAAMTTPPESGEELIEPDFIPTPTHDDAEDVLASKEQNPVGEASEKEAVLAIDPQSAGPDEPESVIPGIMTKDHINIDAPANNGKWEFKKNSASREPGWKPRLVGKRPRINFADTQAIVETPSETNPPVEVKQTEKLAAPESPKETEKEDLVKLVKKVIFDETGGEISLDEYRGLAEKFSDLASGIIDKVKGADSHKENAKQTEKIGHIVWSNPSPLEKITTTLDGGQKMDPDQEKIAQLDQSVSEELNMDPSPELDQIAAPAAPVASEKPSLEFNDVTPAAEAGPGPAFTSSEEAGNPLEASDEASQLLHQAIGQTVPETPAAPDTSSPITEPLASNKTPELSEPPAPAAPQPIASSEQHFAASISAEPTATIYPNPETPLVPETQGEQNPVEAAPLTLVGPESDAKEAEDPSESPTISLDTVSGTTDSQGGLTLQETPNEPVKKKGGLLSWLGFGNKSPVAELHSKIGDPTPVDSSVASKAQKEMIAKQNHEAGTFKEAA